MKKLIWIVIVIVLVTAALIPLLTKEKENGSIMSNEKKTSSKAFYKPEKITINNDSVIVKIIDIKGAEINLTTYNSICKNYKSLNYHGSVLSNIFQEQKVIPVQIENGAYYMYFIDKIDDYYFDGVNSHILLKNGNKITGMPVKDYEISGKSIYGDITIPMGNIQYAKFNRKISTEITNKSKKDLKSYLGFVGNGVYDYWPESFEKYAFIIETRANSQIRINAPIFVYDKHGCDDSWIPCKSYQVWKLSNYFIPVKNGTIIMKIPVNNIELVTFNIIEKEYNKEYYLDITLKNKEQLTNVLLYDGKDGYESDFCVNIGILGLIENGVTFLPVERIKQLKMISN